MGQVHVRAEAGQQHHRGGRLAACKGASQARDTGRGHGSKPGLRDPNSALFWEVPRVLRALREAIRTQKPPNVPALALRYIVENVVRDADTLQQVNKEMGVDPILVNVERTCPAP